MAIEVTIEAELTVETEESYNTDEGGDPVYVTDAVRIPVERTQTVEYPTGYANLEWARQDAYHFDAEWVLGYAGVLDPEDIGFESFNSSDPESIDVRVRGDAHDWVAQAFRQEGMTEGKTLIETLEWFRGWENTNSRGIDRAIEEVSDLDGADKGPGEMTVEEYAEFTHRLNSISEGKVPPKDPDQLNREYFADAESA